MTDSISAKDCSESTGYSEGTILDVMGFTLATAVMFTSAFSPLLATKTTDVPVMHGITHGFMFLAMGLFYFILSRHIKNRDTFVRSKTFKTAFIAFQLALPVAWLCEKLFALELPPFFVVILWIALGLSNAYFSCSWTDAQSSIREDHIQSANLCSFGIAGCITVAVLAMPSLTGVIAFIVLDIASFIMLLHTPVNTVAEMSERDEKWFAENSKYSANGSYIMIVDGMMIGIIAGLLMARISKDILPPFTMGLAFICVALVFFFVEKRRPALLALGRSQMVFFPAIIGCLILTGFLDAPWNTFASIPLFIVLYLFDYTNSSVLSLRGNILAISPSYCFAKGRIFIIFGQTAGWFIGAFLASDIGRGSLPIATGVLIVLACFYITAATVIPDKYPLAPEETGESIALPVNSQTLSEPIIERPYKKKCANATAAFNLTPREGEILFFLAKGRNAKYISEQLYVAERTIKTHTYHIYQKMEIHSQQELMDIVENEKLTS